jgi:hypothetical protein
MSKSNLESWAERYAEVQITRIRLYSEKLNHILVTKNNQFFPPWKHYHLEDVIECGEIVLEEFKLTPPMQGLVLEQWLLQDEIVRYQAKCSQTKDCGFKPIIQRLENRTQVVHQLFLQQLKKSGQSRRRVFLFNHEETALHIGHDWVCHIMGHPDLLKR